MRALVCSAAEIVMTRERVPVELLQSIILPARSVLEVRSLVTTSTSVSA
jgi:hypothetical protein